MSQLDLQYKNRGEFVAAILEGLPEAPQYFAHNAAMNRQGPEPVDLESGVLARVAPSAGLTDPAKYFVVDVRDAEAVCRRTHSKLGQHRPARTIRDMDRDHGPLGRQNVLTGSGRKSKRPCTGCIVSVTSRSALCLTPGNRPVCR